MKIKKKTRIQINLADRKRDTYGSDLLGISPDNGNNFYYFFIYLYFFEFSFAWFFFFFLLSERLCGGCKERKGELLRKALKFRRGGGGPARMRK